MSQTDKKTSKASKSKKKQNSSAMEVDGEEMKMETNSKYERNELKEETEETKDNNMKDEEKIDNQCLVCIDQIKEECVLNPCQHKYCYECIVDWMKQRQRCPLCNAEVVELIRSDQLADVGNIITKVSDIADSAAIEKIKQNNEQSRDVIEGFECLDHNYLKNEVDKLLSKLEFVQKKMQSNSNKYDDFNWFVIESIDDQIFELENIVEEFREFNPQEIATNCILLEEHLDVIRNNKFDLIEEYYSDLYAIQLQKEEEEIVNHHHNNLKSTSSNNKQNNNNKKGSNGNGKNLPTSKNGASSKMCEDEDEFYDYDDLSCDFKDYSIKNFKPKAPKKKFNTTVPSASASVVKI